MSTPEVEALARLAGMGVPLSDVQALNAETPRTEIRQRQGPGGKSLDYVDARYVMDVLDRVVGPQNWMRDHRMTESGKVACGIGINVDGNWIWKWDGAGETDIEGEKGSFSDSFKRAAVSWGIARDLYDKDRPAAPVAARQPSRGVPPQSNGTQAQDDLDRAWDAGEIDDDYQPSRPADSDVCPIHGKPWTNGTYGWYCRSKAQGNEPANAKGYCTAKPTKAWQARHEV